MPTPETLGPTPPTPGLDSQAAPGPGCHAEPWEEGPCTAAGRAARHGTSLRCQVRAELGPESPEGLQLRVAAALRVPGARGEGEAQPHAGTAAAVRPLGRAQGPAWPGLRCPLPGRAAAAEGGRRAPGSRSAPLCRRLDSEEGDGAWCPEVPVEPGRPQGIPAGGPAQPALHHAGGHPGPPRRGPRHRVRPHVQDQLQPGRQPLDLLAEPAREAGRRRAPRPRRGRRGRHGPCVGPRETLRPGEGRGVRAERVTLCGNCGALLRPLLRCWTETATPTTFS